MKIRTHVIYSASQRVTPRLYARCLTFKQHVRAGAFSSLLFEIFLATSRLLTLFAAYPFGASLLFTLFLLLLCLRLKRIACILSLRNMCVVSVNFTAIHFETYPAAAVVTSRICVYLACRLVFTALLVLFLQAASRLHKQHFSLAAAIVAYFLIGALCVRAISYACVCMRARNTKNIFKLSLNFGAECCLLARSV